MLGMVFTEFVELMAHRHSPVLTDAVLTRAASPHGMIATLFAHYRQPCTIRREPVVTPPGTVFHIVSCAP